ncbi:MAG: hypothetical protein A3B13_01280 [Candidatus Liptonbacteria bacterium RIFCSPLOWO2_01_FULL_45_15]|uniref:Uncharacterized protein n=1 Tax=Candidatus Liptonbacteria bacterium RIFCSPLOWO2_01_FULL_45_15 TaxID=1798649 RepID=A0A1G2CG87_9BACT|nr:MAG: hypothetical protein A3B13_01280 [Candidatus Liptonbacteria bacterium RIFCSPLOWO2_01_FULL_45_15]
MSHYGENDNFQDVPFFFVIQQTRQITWHFFGFCYSLEMKENPEHKEIERIQTAALLLGDQMYTGQTHLEALVALQKEHPDYNTWVGERAPKQGFITSTGRFVDRDEAGKIADNAEQLEHLESNSRRRARGDLHSEDLAP